MVETEAAAVTYAVLVQCFVTRDLRVTHSRGRSPWPS